MKCSLWECFFLPMWQAGGKHLCLIEDHRFVHLLGFASILPVIVLFSVLPQTGVTHFCLIEDNIRFNHRFQEADFFKVITYNKEKIIYISCTLKQLWLSPHFFIRSVCWRQKWVWLLITGDANKRKTEKHKHNSYHLYQFYNLII